MSRCFPHRPNTLQDSRPLAAGCKSVLPRARRILRQKMKSLGGFLASDFGPRNRPLWERTEPGRLALSAEAACHGDGRTRTISVTCGACAARLRGSAPRRCPCGAVARRGACARRAYRRRVAARRTPQPGAPAVSELGAALSLMHPTRQSDDALGIYRHPWKTFRSTVRNVLHTRNTSH